jgi:hypothetical protein
MLGLLYKKSLNILNDSEQIYTESYKLPSIEFS